MVARIWGTKDNSDNVKEALSEMEKKIGPETMVQIKNVAAFILRDAKINAPVISGRLRGSGRLDAEAGSGNDMGTIYVKFGGPGTLVDYAVYVELGTWFFPGRFFLQDAVKTNQDKLISLNLFAIQKIISEETDKANSNINI